MDHNNHCNNHLPWRENLKISKFFALDIVLTGDICPKCIFFWGKLLWLWLIGNRTTVSSNSVCNHTLDWQIRLPLRDRPILLIPRMTTDRIGLHPVLLPLWIIHQKMFSKYARDYYQHRQKWRLAHHISLEHTVIYLIYHSTRTEFDICS